MKNNSSESFLFFETSWLDHLADLEVLQYFSKKKFISFHLSLHVLFSFFFFLDMRQLRTVQCDMR